MLFLYRETARQLATETTDMMVNIAPGGVYSLCNASYGDTAEVLDFLLTRPTPQDILAFKVSNAAQARLRLLLDKNRKETLSTLEEAELDFYEQLEHLMILLKAKAYALASRQ